jgi:hypothetical protein
MPLPVDGQTGWGDVLNADITTLQTQANSTQTNLTSHAGNTPTDPHGDRAYAQSLVNPITSGVNSANGFVQLNSSGHIPSNLISGSGSTTGGMYSGVFDAVATYGAVAGNGQDQSVAIQNALNAAGTAGGGIVWVGPGVFSMTNYVVMPSNTWLMMSEGTTLSRIPGSPNAKYLITNVKFGTSNTPASRIKITGGTLDAVGLSSMTSNCTPIFIIQSNVNMIQGVYINNVFSNPAIEINGCTFTTIDTCVFDGTGINSFSVFPTVPAIRINVSDSGTTPSGLGGPVYNNTVTTSCRVTNSSTQFTSSTHGCYGALIGSDLTSSHVSDKIFAIGCSTLYASALGSGSAFYPNGQWTHSTSTGNLFI